VSPEIREVRQAALERVRPARDRRPDLPVMLRAARTLRGREDVAARSRPVGEPALVPVPARRAEKAAQARWVAKVGRLP
jgi:hypothetical protein